MTNRRDMIDEALMRPGRLEVNFRNMRYNRSKEVKYKILISLQMYCLIGTNGNQSSRRTRKIPNSKYPYNENARLQENRA